MWSWVVWSLEWVPMRPRAAEPSSSETPLEGNAGKLDPFYGRFFEGSNRPRIGHDVIRPSILVGAQVHLRRAVWLK